MHEQTLMMDLIRKINEVATREGGGAVERAEVTLGALSHFTPEHFREHFARAAEGTVAETARLTINESKDHDAPFAQTVRLDRLELTT